MLRILRMAIPLKAILAPTIQYIVVHLHLYGGVGGGSR